MSFGYSELGCEKSPAQECRPDPEMLLQRARARKENHEKVLDLLRQINEVPINYNISKSNFGEVILQYIGSQTVSVWEADREINRLLAEIDKG